jgi:hypothetical protein
LGDLLFWILMGLPFICILLFSMLPTLWRAQREGRLRTAAIAGDVHFTPGYFRLHPYGAADGATYKRLDGADAVVLNWLMSAKPTLLYRRIRSWKVIPALGRSIAQSARKVGLSSRRGCLASMGACGNCSQH